ncbi:MAG: hypothetical protein OEW98_10005 [Betaproteobacteria bacterium]|jgi:hypothetical protein|nr:hypothetical protein [Betaproteobacteria bacterium]
MSRYTFAVIAVALAAFATVSVAQKPSVYPAKKQTAQQQKKDDGECMVWAKKDTGIDPVAASQPAPQKTGPAVGGGERLKGAAGGALVGGIAGDAGAGAAVGMAVGGVKARQNQKAQNQQAQQQQQGALNTFYKAYAACMEGRGYTVK